MADEILKLDLYGILEVSPDADDKQILSGYRKKARKCHPDKNPDNPKAAEEFHQLTQALEILTDAAAKAAYDKVLKAKKAAEIRHNQLHGKRKKLKEDLEAREAAAEKQKQEQASGSNKRTLQQEIERLRREGSKLVEEEKQRAKEEAEIKVTAVQADSETSPARFKLKWKAKKTDESNGGYSQESVHKLLHKYGDIVALSVSSKKKGRAIVEFASQDEAMLAVQNERGLPDNPLSWEWISGQPRTMGGATAHTTAAHGHQRTESPSFTTQPKNTVSGFSFKPQISSVAAAAAAGDRGCPSETDYEDLVMRKLRQAEERKRLAEQIAREDAEEEAAAAAAAQGKR